MRKWQGGSNHDSDEAAPRQARALKESLRAWYAAKAPNVAITCGETGLRAAAAARDAIADQIERRELTAAEQAGFEDHCESVLRIHLALLELAQICKRGSESSWPSPAEATNADVWQSTYERLAVRISDGRVDIDRPLQPLARTTAYRLMLSERREQSRLHTLTDVQLHRFNLGEERSPEEQAELARRAATLREGLLRLRRSGRLSADDYRTLLRRYVADWTSAEVAAASGTTAANVRQLCARRCGLLQAELSGREPEDAA